MVRISGYGVLFYFRALGLGRFGSILWRFTRAQSLFEKTRGGNKILSQTQAKEFLEMHRI